MFSQKQLRFMDYVEQVYMLNHVVPSKELCLQNVLGLTGSEYDEYVKNPRMQEHMREDRGIELLGSVEGGALTPEQLVVCNTLLNLADTRSSRKKLQDLGITPSKWAAWKKDPAVQTYLRARSEGELSDGLVDAHLALVDTASRGDVKAIQLLYEITGRWSSKTVGELNVQFLLGKIIEVLQRHVTDSQMLANISQDLLSLVGTGEQPAISGPVSQPISQPVHQPTAPRVLDAAPVAKALDF